MEIEYVVMDGCGGLKSKDQVGRGGKRGMNGKCIERDR